MNGKLRSFAPLALQKNNNSGPNPLMPCRGPGSPPSAYEALEDFPPKDFP